MEVELDRRARDGDDAAFASIAASCNARLHGVALRILRDPDLAADATQHALMSSGEICPSCATLNGSTRGLEREENTS